MINEYSFFLTDLYANAWKKNTKTNIDKLPTITTFWPRERVLNAVTTEYIKVGVIKILCKITKNKSIFNNIVKIRIALYRSIKKKEEKNLFNK